MRLFLLLCLCFSCIDSVMAQRYSFANYNVENGLVQSSVSCFLRDSYDNLWIGTRGGLSRFDGHSFTNYNVKDGLRGMFIRDLLMLGDSLLIATNEGLNVFDGQQFHYYPYTGSGDRPLSLRKMFVRDERLMLIYQDSKLVSLRKGIFREIDTIAGSFVTGFSSDLQGVNWVSTFDGRIFTVSENGYREQPTTGANLEEITDMMFDRQGRLWLTSFQQLWSLRSGKLERYPLDLPGSPRIFMMKQDKEGLFWIGTNKGVFTTRLGHEDSPGYEKHQLKDAAVSHVFCDREGTLLMGTNSHGFYIFRGRAFAGFNRQDGLEGKSYMSIFKDSRGDYWFGSYGGGLSCFDGEQVRNYTTADGLRSNFIADIDEDSLGNLWLATMEGVQLLDTERGNFFLPPSDTEGLAGRQVYVLQREAGQAFLLGTDVGVFSYSRANFRPVERIGYEAEKRPVMGIVRRGEGRYYFADDADVYTLERGRSRRLLSAEQFRGAYLTGLVMGPQSRLWISTLNGQLFRYDEAADSLQHMNESLQLPQMVIYSLTFTDEGSLLLGTQRGIRQVLFAEGEEYPVIRHYSREDGFMGVECNTNAILKDAGKYWFGTVNGVYRFDPAEMEQTDDPPQAYLTDIRLFYEQVDWLGHSDSVSRWFHLPRELELSHKANHLVFNFKAVSLLNAKKIRYSYRLLGMEEVWSPPTDHGEAVYANIPPGDYTFQLRAKVENGPWQATPAVFTFSIAPPFWQSWWFFLLSFLAFFLLIRLYIYRRLSLERERRVELELEVRKRTREIKSLNNSLEERVRERTNELELSNKRFEVEFELRKLDQEKLAQQEREYRQLVNNLREVIFKTDTGGYLTFLNNTWQEYMGYRKAESVGFHFSEFVHAPTGIKKNYLQVFNAVIGREMPYFETELKMQRKDGSNFWAKVSVRTAYDDAGHIIGTYGSLVDIDQRKKAEFRLKASEDRYKFLIENTQDIITLQDKEQHYSYASPRIYEVAGIDPNDLIGKSLYDFIHPDDLQDYLMMKEEVISHGKSRGATVRLRNGDGQYRWYETFLKPIMNESGELQSFITSSRDVTEKVEVKREIEQVRKKVAQDFHDEMGNNLASISVLSQIIVRKLNGHDEEISALLHKIDLSSKNLFHGARDFIWAINPKNDNLKEVYFNLKDFGEDLFENTGIGFYATFEQPEQQVELKLPIGWSRQMVLIFKEALTNVLKYADCRSVRLNFLATQDFFRIELDDDGRGFDTETLEKSRGISNMQDRARKMRGQLEIKSLPGRGTRIVFRHKIPQLGGAMSQHV